jgi:ActR/RegA family two-component response regulator
VANGNSSRIAAGSAGKVLLVDDDAPLRRNLVRALERLGYEIATAGGLREAYEVAANFVPEFAVVDLNLADGHGMELVETLQDLRPGIRIVVVTGYDSIASSIVATKAGAVGYLAKPVKPEELAAALAGTFDQAQSTTARCRPTGCAGSTSSGSSSSATATCPRPPDGSTCTAARCSAS